MSQAFTPILMAGLALVVVSLVAAALHWIPLYCAWGVLAISQLVTGVGGFLTGNTTAASISTAAAAYTAWQWWNGGGGDGTKRRLQAWTRRFQGVRRTAPAGGQ